MSAQSQSPEDKINGILLDLLDISEDAIRPEASLISNLGASSVDLVEIITALENEFNLDISDEDAARIRTVKDIIDYVQTHSG